MRAGSYRQRIICSMGIRSRYSTPPSHQSGGRQGKSQIPSKSIQIEVKLQYPKILQKQWLKQRTAEGLFQSIHLLQIELLLISQKDQQQMMIQVDLSYVLSTCHHAEPQKLVSTQNIRQQMYTIQTTPSFLFFTLRPYFHPSLQLYPNSSLPLAPSRHGRPFLSYRPNDDDMQINQSKISCRASTSVRR